MFVYFLVTTFVSCHHPTGSVLKVDLTLPGFNISTPGHGNTGDWCSGADSWQIDRSGDKSQRRDHRL